jgi:transcriptional regulator with GAF, ATPase, and Fis domain
VRKSSTSGGELAQELLEDQPVNGFHQDLESQSAIHLNGLGLDHGAASTRLMQPEAFLSIVYASHAMDEVINKIKRARDSSAPALITGETGTGKELIARAVHAVSPRHGREFVPFNCGDVTPELIASELFGYRRGAFTSADRDYKGVIHEAEGGTLLLDEIGELRLEAQSKLLRFLQESEIRPLGTARPIKVNVRVIAATNRDLEADVRAGRFRDDLYYRLNVFRFHIPPLRERREDIPLLIEHFLGRRQQQAGKQGLRLSAMARNALLGYQWPGNAREMENVLYRLVAFAENYEEIGQKRVLEEIGGCAPPPAAAIVEDKIVIDRRFSYHERKNELERLSIIEALNETGGNLSRAAARMGMSIFGLRKAVKRFGIGRRKDGHQ